MKAHIISFLLLISTVAWGHDIRFEAELLPYKRSKVLTVLVLRFNSDTPHEAMLNYSIFCPLNGDNIKLGENTMISVTSLVDVVSSHKLLIENERGEVNYYCDMIDHTRWLKKHGTYNSACPDHSLAFSPAFGEGLDVGMEEVVFKDDLKHNDTDSKVKFHLKLRVDKEVIILTSNWVEVNA